MGYMICSQVLITILFLNDVCCNGQIVVLFFCCVFFRFHGIGWVNVRNDSPIECKDERDLDGLSNTWEHYLKTNQPVKYEVIKQMAQNHNVKSGKWLFFAESGGKIDQLWSVVAKAIIESNDLPCNAAKVSSYDGSSSHVVCIYNNDFTNSDQVMRAEQAIRNMGIKARLLYKPDVYTLLGVYSGNPWGLTPNILVSNFDLMKGSSVIENSYGISQI